jgi:hypothetical protein
MKDPRSQFAIKLLPSLTDFAFLMPIVFLFARWEGVTTLLSDCYTGWHIRTGEWILANHAVPARDIFSFSRAGDPWYAWEWLSDVLFACLNSRGGLAAVVLLGILLIAITFTLLFRLARRKSNAIVALLVTMVAAAASSVHWLARPHLFTLLFVVLFYGALERVRDGRAVPGPSAGGHDSLDQPARRILRGHSDARRLRRRRSAQDGIFSGPRRTAASRTQSRPVFPVRVGLPGGQPGQSVLLSLARTRVAVLVRPVPGAARE